MNADVPGPDEVAPVIENDLREQPVSRRVDDVGRERVDSVRQRCAETVRQHVGNAGFRRVVQNVEERAGHDGRRRRRRGGGVQQGQLGDRRHVERVLQEVDDVAPRCDDQVLS